MLEKGMQDINGSLHAVIHAINKNYQKKNVLEIFI